MVNQIIKIKKDSKSLKNCNQVQKIFLIRFQVRQKNTWSEIRKVRNHRVKRLTKGSRNVGTNWLKSDVKRSGEGILELHRSHRGLIRAKIKSKKGSGGRVLNRFITITTITFNNLLVK